MTSSASPHKSLVAAILIECTRHGILAYEIRQGMATPLGASHPMHFGAPKGHTDIIAVVHGHVFYIEVKTGTGRLSKPQQNWKRAVERAGATHIVARSLEDIAPVFARKS